VALRGYGDKSLRFDGTDDYVDFGVTNFAFERTDPFSFSGWINIGTSNASNRVVFGRALGSATFQGWWIRYEPANRSFNVFMASDFSASNHLWARALGQAQISEWVRFQFSYDGTSSTTGINLYIDGVAVTKTVVANGLTASMVAVGVNARMGTITDNTLDFLGNLTDIAVYSDVLTATEMSNIHFSGIYPTDNLYARYLFDEGSGATLGDTSGNGRHGTITAATWSTTTVPLKATRTATVTSQNLVQQSQTLDNVYWTPASATFTADAGTAPDGTTTADRLTMSAGTASHYFQRGSLQVSLVTNRVYTFSIYAKYENLAYIILSVNTGATKVWFNIQNGTIGSTDGTAAIRTQIEVAQNGYYRCSVTFAASAYTVQCYGSNADAVQSWTAAGTETILFWGAQIVQANWFGPYTVTTSAVVDNGAIRSIVT
jgi:hypothetical protein